MTYCRCCCTPYCSHCWGAYTGSLGSLNAARTRCAGYTVCKYPWDAHTIHSDCLISLFLTGSLRAGDAQGELKTRTPITWTTRGVKKRKIHLSCLCLIYFTLYFTLRCCLSVSWDLSPSAFPHAHRKKMSLNTFSIWAHWSVYDLVNPGGHLHALHRSVHFSPAYILYIRAVGTKPLLHFMPLIGLFLQLESQLKLRNH